MRSKPLVLALLLACAGDGLAVSPAPAPAAKATVRATYIVEFVEPPLATYRGGGERVSPKLAGLKATSPAATGARKLDADAPASKAYRAALAELRGERLAQAEARLGRALPPLFVYDVVSNGVALELSPAEATALQSLDGVARVVPDWHDRLLTDSGPRWIHADQIWNGLVSAPSRGEGVVLGLVDSGINRTHPSFAAVGPGDGFGHSNPKGRFFGRCATPATATECNAKLIGIYDFTTSNSEETDNGLDVTGHGSHVGSTAAGNVLNATISPTGGTVQSRQISGVAPHANIISYKACEGRANGASTCQGSWTLASLNQAVADGVDVINYSIGGTPRDPWGDSGANAMLAAREAGVVVAVAAGNEGPGVGSIESPGDAPWVIGAAAASHDRAIRNRLLDLTGGATAPPNGGVLVGSGATGGYGPRALVIDPLFPGCAQGNELDADQTGISNPWPPGRFNGEIVVCERGTQARVAKSNNVRLAGGGGMILVNREVEGEGISADAHSIPSVHLGYLAGRALKDWMAGGTGHSGRIEGNSVVNLPELGDVLAGFSGRGPALTVGIVKPDLTAPGVAIFGADAGTGALGFKSGTSMATPHVAGAALLLAAVKPAWSPSQIESALTTTSRDGVRLDDQVTPAVPFDEGAGMIDVALAVQAPLFFDITPTEFRNARPSLGGVPRNLNRPSIAHERCFASCSASRTVTDMAGGGSWRVEVDLPSPAAATVTPSTFTLAAGQSMPLSFNFDVSDAMFPGSWVYGRVKFIRTSGSGPNPEIALALYSDPGNVPAEFEVGGAAESGFRDIPLSGLAAMPDATFDATPLVAPTLTERTLAQDPTRDDRYDSFATGTFFNLVTVPAAGVAGTKYRLFSQTRSATAWDVDLFVGQDLDGDNQPDESEQLCSSTGERAEEECELDIAMGSASRTYWVLVQNWDAGMQGSADAATASDAVVLETALVALDGPASDALVATGPGHLDAQEGFALRLAWNDPTLLPGEKRIGYLRIGASPATLGQLATSRVEVSRTQPGENAAALLAPNGTRHMRLAPGAAQDRLYLDVPPNATSLTVTTAGSGEVDLYLARDPAPTVPAIAAAPARGMAAGTSIHPGATEAVTLNGTALQPGRWYVTPVNPGAGSAEFDLSVALQTSTARPQPKFGPYYNPQRSGAGLFLYPAGNGALWSLVWYTYLQDGTPTWYLGVAPAPAANDGVWRVQMSRYSWDGSANAGTVVGEAQLALTGTAGYTFSWNLDGQSGSEPMTYLDGGACAPVGGASINGMWYSPTRSGFGYAINAYPGVESNALYFYDEQGIARWALGAVAPFGAGSMPLSQYRNGFCPLCTFTAPTTVQIGTLTRRYDSAAAGNIAVSATLQAPLSGSWNVDLPAVKLTDGLQCQ